MPFEIEHLLGEAERSLLVVLTHRVRVLSLPQIARTWTGLQTRRQLQRLEERGLVVCFAAVIHPELPLHQPVASWRIGEQTPDFGAASYALRSRWSQAGVSTLCVIASRAAGRMFGGHGGRFPRESEETHDVHLAAVYLRLLKADPKLASSWIHEEEIRAERETRRGKLPDAVLKATGKIIEFGGAYKKEKLISFHEYCRASRQEYEVW
jgi:hypothetical protein